MIFSQVLNTLRSVYGRFLLFALLFTVLPLFLLGLLLLNRESQRIMTYTEQRLSGEADKVANRLEEKLKAYHLRSRHIATIPLLQEHDIPLQQRFLQTVHERYYADYGLLAIIDRNGMQQANSKNAPLRSVESIPSYQRARAGQQAWFIAPGLNSSELIYHLHTPIMKQRQVIGVLDSPITLARLSTVVGYYEGRSEFSKAYVLNEDGHVILDSEALQVENGGDYSSIFLPPAGGESADHQFVRYSMNGESYLAASIYLPKRNWMVVVAQPTRIVLAPLRHYQRMALLSIAGATICSCLGALWLAQNFSRPIQNVAKAASALANGSSAVPLPTSWGGKEMTILLNSFATMRKAVIEREQGLRASETRNHAILQAFPDVLFRISRNGTILDVHIPQRNSSIQKLQGQDFHQFIRRMDMGGSYDILFEQFKRAIQHQEAQLTECTLMIGGEQKVDFEVRFTPSEKDELLAIFRNITKRKQDAAIIQKQIKMMESSYDGIALLNSDLIYTYANGAYAHLHGYAQGYNLVGEGVQATFAPEELVRLKEQILPCVQQKGYWRGDSIGLRTDGAVVQNELTLTKIETGDFICVMRDIGERKEAEKLLELERYSLATKVKDRTVELEKANSELVRAVQLKDEFLANMSHELRTPLNAILGMTEAMQEEIYGAITPAQKSAIGRAEDSARHLLSLINDILDVSKIEARQLQLDFDTVYISDISRASMTLVKIAGQRKNLQMEMELDERFPMIEGDGRRLKQILVNLLSNAVKFTPDGGRVGLRVRPSSDSTSLLFQVWDTGIGISQEQQALLFKPFVQLDGGLSRNHEGAGLGLALSQRLAELHQGKITVESRLGEGSKFTLALPIKTHKPAIKKEMAQGISADLSDSRPASPPPLLLLAEDNELSATTFVDYLEHRGYRVHLARNGIEVIELADRLHPDLILMDIQMPILNGMEATKRIRSRPEMAKTPIIALTGLAMEGDAEKCLQAGATAYLTKPVTLKNLMAAIQNQLHPVIPNLATSQG